MPQHVHVLKRFEGMLELGFRATHVVGAMAYKIEPCEPHQMILSMPPGEMISVYRGVPIQGGGASKTLGSYTLRRQDCTGRSSQPQGSE